MRNGEGSITEKKRPDGKSYNPKRWQVCVSYTVKVCDSEGKERSKRIRRQGVARGPKAEANRLRLEIIAAHDDDGNPIDEFQQAINQMDERPSGQITLTEMIEKWNLARKTAGKASERTIREDRKRLTRVEKYLGSMPLDSITPQMIVEAYAGIREEYGVSGTTMNHIHTLLKNVFTHAVNYDLMRKNPCCCVDTPKREDPQRRSLSKEEGMALLQAIDKAEAEEYTNLAEKEERREYREEHGYARDRGALRGIHHLSGIIAVRLGLATGMRRGEVIALCWKHIDLNRRTVRVCQSATIKGTVKQPKTAAGIRTLAIDENTAAHLKQWKKRQRLQLAKISVETSEETPVCCTDVGTMMRVDNFETWWRSWRQGAGFPALKFHELRHTQATMLLANGIDVKTVQTRLGHANPSITLGWYAHAIPENDHEAAEMLGNLFNGKAESNDPEQSGIEDEPGKGSANAAEMSSECLPESLPESPRFSNSEKMSSKCLPKSEEGARKDGFKVIRLTA